MGFAKIWQCIAILTQPVWNVNHGDGDESGHVGGQDGLQGIFEMYSDSWHNLILSSIKCVPHFHVLWLNWAENNITSRWRRSTFKMDGLSLFFYMMMQSHILDNPEVMGREKKDTWYPFLGYVNAIVIVDMPAWFWSVLPHAWLLSSIFNTTT